MKNHTTPCAEHDGPLTEPPAEIASTLRVIGGKWKLLILWQLRRRDCRFNELRRGIPGATQHVLTTQLRELEADGILTRTVYAEVPPKVVYALTDHGRSLDHVVEVLFRWGATHISRERPEIDQRTPVPAAG